MRKIHRRTKTLLLAGYLLLASALLAGAVVLPSFGTGLAIGLEQSRH